MNVRTPDPSAREHPLGGASPDHPEEERSAPWSPWDPLRRRVQDQLEADIDQRDPQYLESIRPVLGTALRYFDPEIQGFEHVPDEGPFLVVGNHSGGMYMPDYWAFLHRWLEERGAEAPLYSLAFDFLFGIPGAASLARKIGAVPASQGNGDRLLARGDPVIVYPGGDADDYRPWTERHQVELRGRTGFVRLALRHGVPVVPLVAHGSHDTIIVLAHGDRVARHLGLDRLRITVMPTVLGPPWGIAPVQLPTIPLPAKVTARVCEPLDWTPFGPEAADDPGVVAHCYEEVLGRMQSNLDELVEALPHPVTTRLGTALGLDRIRRLWPLGR